jgi:hyperosmotically inducible protein
LRVDEVQRLGSRRSGIAGTGTVFACVVCPEDTDRRDEVMADSTRDTRILSLLSAAVLAGALSTGHASTAAIAPSDDTHLAISGATHGSSHGERDLRRLIADAWIDAVVKQELMRDETVGAFDIAVKTHRGIVRLSGQVRSEADRNRAVAVAIRTPGVYGVNDTDLRVRES